MSENKEPIFPEFHILPERLCRVGRWLNHLVLGPRIFSEVSDHFQHPLDPPLESVTDWPIESDGIDPPILWP